MKGADWLLAWGLCIYIERERVRERRFLRYFTPFGYETSWRSQTLQRCSLPPRDHSLQIWAPQEAPKGLYEILNLKQNLSKVACVWIQTIASLEFGRDFSVFEGK